jgi:hypothetical protein
MWKTLHHVRMSRNFGNVQRNSIFTLLSTCDTRKRGLAGAHHTFSALQALLLVTASLWDLLPLRCVESPWRRHPGAVSQLRAVVLCSMFVTVCCAVLCCAGAL